MAGESYIFLQEVNWDDLFSFKRCIGLGGKLFTSLYQWVGIVKK